MNTSALPVRPCNSDKELATAMPFTLTHGPVPIRDRASVGLLPLSGSWSALRYARHVLLPAPTAAARR
jgi:hypothetical protein